MQTQVRWYHSSVQTLPYPPLPAHGSSHLQDGVQTPLPQRRSSHFWSLPTSLPSLVGFSFINSILSPKTSCSFFFKKNFIYLLYFWLCEVLVAAHGIFTCSTWTSLYLWCLGLVAPLLLLGETWGPLHWKALNPREVPKTSCS